MVSSTHVTELLRREGRGDPKAAAELLQALYGELHDVAAALMRGQRPDHTLQPTALVHEAYVRLLGSGEDGRGDRERFLAYAARAMRSALSDHARARRAQKRGGGLERKSLEAVTVCLDKVEVDVLDLDDVLDRLAAESERAARIVELRFFGGLTSEETARVLGVSLRTVERDWRVARAWLADELEGPGAGRARER